MSNKKDWYVYLSGEIHTNWRDKIRKQASQKQLPISFYAPELNHEHSDHCGVHILGEETHPFWKDHKAAKINCLRNQTLIDNSDIVIVRFGDKYKQWNAAFDAGYAIAKGKHVITLHEDSSTHPLKEINAQALVSARTTKQVVETLAYITKQ